MGGADKSRRRGFPPIHFDRRRGVGRGGGDRVGGDRASLPHKNSRREIAREFARKSWEGEPQAARDAPKKAFRKYQPKMYPAIRRVLPLSSVAPSAAATTAEARATSAGLRPATGRIAARENPDLRPTAPEETNADAPSATDDDVDGVAHRGAANAAGDEDRDVLHLARGATRRIEEEAIAAMISRSERACA